MDALDKEMKNRPDLSGKTISIAFKNCMTVCFMANC